MTTVWFNEKNSYNYNLIVLDIGKRQKGQEIFDTYNIPYRSGDLTISTNTYEPYLRDMEFLIKDKSNIGDIYKWLNGTGRLRIEDGHSIDGGEGFNVGGHYLATVTKITTEKHSNRYDSINVTFKCQPFYYLITGNTLQKFKKNNIKISGQGSVKSEPYIKIIGNGSFQLAVNDKICNFKDVNGYIEIDSNKLIAYKDTMNQGDKMEGDFPYLNPTGINYITWTGNITELQIRPRWREI